MIMKSVAVFNPTVPPIVRPAAIWGLSRHKIRKGIDLVVYPHLLVLGNYSIIWSTYTNDFKFGTGGKDIYQYSVPPKMLEHFLLSKNINCCIDVI